MLKNSFLVSLALAYTPLLSAFTLSPISEKEISFENSEIVEEQKEKPDNSVIEFTPAVTVGLIVTTTRLGGVQQFKSFEVNDKKFDHQSND